MRNTFHQHLSEPKYHQNPIEMVPKDTAARPLSVEWLQLSGRACAHRRWAGNKQRRSDETGERTKKQTNTTKTTNDNESKRQAGVMPPDQVSAAAARTLPNTRAGGQDDVS